MLPSLSSVCWVPLGICSLLLVFPFPNNPLLSINATVHPAQTLSIFSPNCSFWSLSCFLGEYNRFCHPVVTELFQPHTFYLTLNYLGNMYLRFALLLRTISFLEDQSWIKKEWDKFQWFSFKVSFLCSLPSCFPSLLGSFPGVTTAPLLFVSKMPWLSLTFWAENI